MARTIECASCGENVSVPDEETDLSVLCPACAGTLAAVAPAPTAALPEPPVASSRPWARASSQSPLEALDPDTLPAPLRARSLADPWPQALRGLVLARRAAVASIPLVVLHLVGVLALLSRREPAVAQWWALAFTALLAVAGVVHLIGQVQFSDVPREAGAGAFGSVAVAMVGGVVFGAGVLLGQPLVAFFAVAVLVLSSMMWLKALRRLGDWLGDPPLRTAAEVYLSRYAFWTVVSIILTVGAIVALTPLDWLLLSAYALVIDLVTLLLAVSYCRLMQTAEAAVCGRAPIARTTKGTE